MSEENVETFEEALRLFGADQLDELVKLLDPEITSTPVEGWPEPGPFLGKEAMLGQFHRLTSDIGAHRITDVSILAADDDWVVGAFRWEVQGAGSGIETFLDLLGACRFENGLIREFHFRTSRDAALEAAGLRE